MPLPVLLPSVSAVASSAFMLRLGLAVSALLARLGTGLCSAVPMIY
ncbi:hypothetical protein [Micromonospora sp. NPDC005220]